MAGTKNLTEGPPIRLILGFAVPLLFGMLFQQFYGMVDTIIVGKHLGVKELAGVGATASVNFMVIGFCCGVCNGFSLPIAKYFGAGDYRGMRRFLTNAILLSAFFSVLVTACVCYYCRDILRLMNTPEDILDSSYTYIIIIFAGIPATILYNLAASVIRSLGDSKTPVLILVGASLMNIAMDLITIGYYGMGVEGAATATVISQLCSGMACVTYLRKKMKFLHPLREEWKPDRKILGELCMMGLPMGLQYSITAIGSVILQTAVNGLGSASVAAMTAGSRLHCFAACPFDALGSAMATWSGQNLGAKKIDRVQAGVQYAAVMGGIYSLLALLVMRLLGGRAALLFINSGETEILEDVKLYINIVTMFFFSLCCVNVFRFAIQGLGYSGLALFAGVFELIGRSAAGLVLIPHFGFAGACMAGPAAWLLADAFLIPVFYWCIRRIRASLNVKKNALVIPRLTGRNAWKSPVRHRHHA